MVQGTKIKLLGAWHVVQLYKMEEYTWIMIPRYVSASPLRRYIDYFSGQELLQFDVSLCEWGGSEEFGYKHILQESQLQADLFHKSPNLKMCNNIGICRHSDRAECILTWRRLYTAELNQWARFGDRIRFKV